MSPAKPSVWKKYRLALIAVLAVLAILLVWYRIEQNRKTRVALQTTYAGCSSLNEVIHGIDYPFAPTDLADRRRVIIADLLGDYAPRANELDDQLRADLKSAIRLKLPPDELAQIALAAGDLPLAENAARQLLGNPENRQPGNYVVLGDILCSAGKYSEAEAQYLKAIELADSDRIAIFANPYQRLARFYSDKKTIRLSLSIAGGEPSEKEQAELRIEKSLEYWQRYLGSIADPFHRPPWRKGGDRTLYAHASIQIANILRDRGRTAEAWHHYVRAFGLYRPKDGSETDNTKKTQQLIEALPAVTAAPNK